MHKLALINIIQYCLGEDACARILLAIQNRAPVLNMVYNKGFANSKWEEEKHPRAKDGKFASSPGGGEPEVTRKEIDDDFARRIETMGDRGEMRELERQRKGRPSNRRRDGSSRHGGEPEVTRKEIDDDFARRIETMDDLGAIQRLEEEVDRRRGTSPRTRGKNPAPGNYLEKHRKKVDKLRQDISEYKDLLADEEDTLKVYDSMTKGDMERLGIKEASLLRRIKEHSDDADYYRSKIKQSEDRLKTLEKRDPARHSEVIVDHLKDGRGEKRGLSDVLPTQQPKPAGTSWLERLEKARDESDEEAIINVADENGDVHEFTPEELDAEIRKLSK